LSAATDERVQSGLLRVAGRAASDASGFAILQSTTPILTFLARSLPVLRTTSSTINSKQQNALIADAALAAASFTLRHECGARWVLFYREQPQAQQNGTSSTNTSTNDIGAICLQSFAAASYHVASQSVRLLASILTSTTPAAIEYVAKHPNIAHTLRSYLCPLTQTFGTSNITSEQRMCAIDVVRLITYRPNPATTATTTSTTTAAECIDRAWSISSRSTCVTASVASAALHISDEALERGRHYAIDNTLVAAVLQLLVYSDRLVAWRAAEVIGDIISTQRFELFAGIDCEPDASIASREPDAEMRGMHQSIHINQSTSINQSIHINQSINQFVRCIE
jgi:hypothetical protein